MYYKEMEKLAFAGALKKGLKTAKWFANKPPVSWLWKTKGKASPMKALGTGLTGYFTYSTAKEMARRAGTRSGMNPFYKI